jgi:hypothetical protein
VAAKPAVVAGKNYFFRGLRKLKVLIKLAVR